MKLLLDLKKYLKKNYLLYSNLEVDENFLREEYKKKYPKTKELWNYFRRTEKGPRKII